MIRPDIVGLWQSAASRSQQARDCGAMHPIETERVFVEDGGVRFVVRRVSNLVRKDAQRRNREPSAAPDNPFLPWDPDLFVAEVSDTHVALLNKFNVIDRHLLIVTRRFEHQETLLDGSDFTALAACMGQGEGLGFYNGGAAAGASQMHKHLQLVPLPLAEPGPAVPMEPQLGLGLGRDDPWQSPRLPFRHALCRLDGAAFTQPEAGGAMLESAYLRLLHAMGIDGVAADGNLRQSAPYNLLVTRSWMLAVPRSCEHFGSVSVNALGFAGSLFVKNDEELETVTRAGPMQVLRAVSRC